MRIKINKEGKIALNQHKVDEVIEINKLEKRIKEIVRNNQDMVFQLKTDRQSKYDNMVKVLDILQLAGAQKISLSTN
jgi:biopolymer transport protein ExbD